MIVIHESTDVMKSALCSVHHQMIDQIAQSCPTNHKWKVRGVSNEFMKVTITNCLDHCGMTWHTILGGRGFYYTLAMVAALLGRDEVPCAVLSHTMSCFVVQPHQITDHSVWIMTGHSSCFAFLTRQGNLIRKISGKEEPDEK